MALGKKLDNILGDYFGDEQVDLQESQKELARMIPISKIKLNPFQTRRSFDETAIHTLAESIKEGGLINPILVLEDYNKKDQPFLLLTGERRLRATKKNGEERILAIVRPLEEIRKDKQALITAFENLEREDLSPIELSETFKMLLDTQNLEVDSLAKKLSKSVQYIKNYLRLLDLSETVKDLLLDKKLTEGQARHLVGLKEEKQNEFAKIIIEKGLTVKEVIKLIKSPNKSSKLEIQHNVSAQNVLKIQSLASKFPNSKVKFEGDDKRGRVVISWKEK